MLDFSRIVLPMLITFHKALGSSESFRVTETPSLRLGRTSSQQTSSLPSCTSLHCTTFMGLLRKEGEGFTNQSCCFFEPTDAAHLFLESFFGCKRAGVNSVRHVHAQVLVWVSNKFCGSFECLPYHRWFGVIGHWIWREKRTFLWQLHALPSSVPQSSA